MNIEHRDVPFGEGNAVIPAPFACGTTFANESCASVCRNVYSHRWTRGDADTVAQGSHAKVELTLSMVT